MEMKQWALIIVGIVLIGAGAVFAMTKINVGAAIAKCEAAGYGESEASMVITSCTADEDYAHDSLAMVVANVAGSPVPTLTEESEKYVRNSLAETEGELEIFTYSTTPGGVRIPIDEKKTRKAKNVQTFISNSTQKIEDINNSIAKPPLEDGSDYFNNIIAAARAVKTSPKTENPLVLVIGSGLSDSQPLNFADSDILHSDPAEVLTELKRKNSILPGEIAGVKIVWSGLGVTAPPQQPLDAKEKSNLQRIYNLIFEYMGASVRMDDTVMAADSVDTEHTVGLVDVNGIKGGIVVYKFGENSIGFQPNTAQIIDTQKANQSLGAVVKSYKQCKNTQIKVEGYQAKLQGENVQESTPLSQQRADTVKSLLVSLGIPDSQIESTGKGTSDFDGRVSEINGEGKWDNKRAEANRVVLVHMAGGGVCN